MGAGPDRPSGARVSLLAQKVPTRPVLYLIGERRAARMRGDNSV